MTPGRPHSIAQLLSACLLVSVSGCKGMVGSPPFATNIPPNACTSAQIALSNPACQLTLGEWKEDYIAQLQEQVWYSVDVGAVDSLSIAHVIAGYFPVGDTDGGPPDCNSVDGGFNTAVNLTMNVLMQDGETSLATGADEHGTACPKPMDLTFRYSAPNTSLIIVLEDDTGKKVDTKNQYSVVADVLQDPDSNEPNDTPQTATPIQLTSSGGGIETGQNGGYLSTPGDLDYYTVTSPSGSYVLWLEISQDPTVPSPPPHNYRLEYYVFAADGISQLAQGYANAGSQYSANQIVIGDALLLPQAGPYYILVQGYRDSNTVGDVPGDLNFKYLIKTILVPLQDPTEPNDSFANPYLVNGGAAIAVGGSQTVTGRTSYVGDADWYAVTLAPNASLALLHYKLTPGAGPGRFPPLPASPNRSLFVYTQAPDTPSCLNPDAGVCLISAPKGSTSAAIAAGACSESPPKCLQSHRVEALPGAPPPVLTNLRNFESNLQVPPHPAAAVTYYFFLQAPGDALENNGYWADDVDYTVLFEHKAEPDALEAIPDPIRMATLAASPGGTAITAYLSYGLGAVNPNTTPTPNSVIFGPEDYDGRGDDVDSYQVALPFTTQQAWQISWSVPTTDGVNPDYDLGFTLSFCDTNPDAGTGTPPCYAMVTHPQSNGSDQLGLAYSPTPYDSWWNPNASVIPDQVVYTQTVAGGVVTTTVTPYGCFCFEPDFVNATATSYFVMNIFPLNRTSWDLVPYTVTTGYSAYPYTFTNTAGGTTTCPATCDFTIN